MHFFFDPFNDEYVKEKCQEIGENHPPFYKELESRSLDRRLFKSIKADQLHDCLCVARENWRGGDSGSGLRVMNHIFYYQHSGLSQSAFLEYFLTESTSKLLVVDNHLAMFAGATSTRAEILMRKMIPVLVANRKAAGDRLEVWVSMAAECFIKSGNTEEANQILDLLNK